VHGSSSTSHDEENVALVANNKKKFKKGPNGGNKSKSEGKKDMIKVKCLHATSLGTLRDSVLIRRRHRQQLQHRWKSFPPSSTRSFP
jgi:hypothetical protein